MATITKPPILDETGQDIVTKLNNINTQVTALNALIADLGLVSITPISQADYNNLSPTDKLNGVFDIYDAVEPDIDGDKVLYSSSPRKTVNEKIDDVQNHIERGTITKQTTQRIYLKRGLVFLYRPNQANVYFSKFDNENIHIFYGSLGNVSETHTEEYIDITNGNSFAMGLFVLRSL